MKILRFILFIFNLLFAVLLIGSTLAGIVSPRKFIWFSLLSYAYLPLLLVNVGFIVLWLFMHRWGWLLSAAAIVLRISFLPLFFQLGGTADVSKPDESQLKVMTFNLHNFAGRNGDHPDPQHGSEFIALVRQEQPDVLCLQEFVNPKGHAVSDTLKQMGYAYRKGVRDRRAGLTLFSRLPITTSKDIGSGGKLYADIKKNGKAVRLVCVHLTSYHLGKGDIATPGSDSREVAAKSKGIAHKMGIAVRNHEDEWHRHLKPVIESTTTPLLLMGDCNDTPSSYFYHQVTQCLSDTFRERGSGMGITYHGLFPAFRIDYIFHSPTLHPLAYKRVKTDISDHYPLIAVFEID